MPEGMLALLMFPTLFVLILAGLPVAYALIACAFAFGLPFFGDKLGTQLFGGLTELAKNYTLSAIPLFILMGTILEASGIAERLFKTMQIWFGRLPGGLCVAALSMCALFAATTGVFGAVEIVIGLMAIPVMLERKYNHGLIAGTICAGGSLGTIIPPSVTMLVYAAIADLSVGDLFAGVLLPGLLMTLYFVVYVVVRCTIRPQDGAPLPRELFGSMSLGEKLGLTLGAIAPALLLIIAVLGSTLAGIASPTEASAVGVLGGIVLAAAYGRLNRKMLIDALKKTVSLSAVIMLILGAGALFSSVFIVNGGRTMVITLMQALDFPPWGVVALFLAILFLLGFILDWVSMLLVCIPVFHPVVVSLGFDPLWFAVMVAVVIQTSYLTPPLAPAVFYFKTIAPPQITLPQMLRGVMPFVCVELFVLLSVAFVPALATYLPQVLFAR
ncbi:MAG: TRAP transporter large permease subunit [Betaproteobacteria bacterium]|nr:TRAP transporter large permease subunit [Betaproteobacteria bacterium]